MNKDFDHRIESLVKLRNKALLPLYDRSISDHMPGGKFDEVLVMNDVIWCPVDVLEVLYQKRKTGAHQACSVDWDWNMRVVYDRWVLRAMSGRCVETCPIEIWLWCAYNRPFIKISSQNMV
jgi:alpha-1,3-mannosyltransferase